MRSSIRRAIVAATAAAVVALPMAPAQAAGPDAGLYGAADPTYDGVFRQSLALMGLAANEVAPPVAAITWLLRQQCADGSFQAYRADVTQPCPKPDPSAFTGPETNSTAMALMAMMALDDSRVQLPRRTLSAVVTAADRAGAWLVRQQNADGGWPYYAGGASDANSTGLSLSAVLTQAPSPSIPAYRKASRFLGTLAGACPAGGIAYQAGSAVDALSTAQGLVGLAGPMPVSGPRRLAAAAPCSNTSTAKAASYLARGLADDGTLPSFSGEPDYSTTATAVLGLVGAGQGRTAVAKATATLKANARAYVTGSGVNPGNAGLLLMVAEATGSSPTRFGGLNLVSTLNGSIRR